MLITIDRPEARNAYDIATMDALAEAMRSCEAGGVRAIVLTGAGDLSFSAGMDLKKLSSIEPETLARTRTGFREAFAAPDRPPIVAAVNGPATGGGFEMMLRCDLAVAAEHATFRLPEVQRGMLPGGGATMLPARIPVAIALELAIVGEAMTAERAYQLGLVNAVVPGPQVLDTAIALAARIAANGPRAVALTRQAMWVTAGQTAAAGWADTQEALQDPTLRAEMQEGIASFVEKRRPRWSTD